MSAIKVTPGSVDYLAAVLVKAATALEDCCSELASAGAGLQDNDVWRLPGWPDLEVALAGVARRASGTSQDLSAASRSLRAYAEELVIIERTAFHVDLPPGIFQARSRNPKPSPGPVKPRPGDWVVSGHILPGSGQFPYKPPKGANGEPKKVRASPSFEDAADREWTWDKSGHHGPHWDVQDDKSRERWNIDQTGNIINHGPARLGDTSSGDEGAVKHVAGAAGAAGAAGGLSRLLHEIEGKADPGPDPVPFEFG